MMIPFETRGTPPFQIVLYAPNDDDNDDDNDDIDDDDDDDDVNSDSDDDGDGFCCGKKIIET